MCCYATHMRKTQDWSTFWVAILTIGLGFFLFDRGSSKQWVVNHAWRLDLPNLLAALLVVAGVYTLLTVVYHIIHIRVE